MPTRAIFFDKDGTLVENIPFNIIPERVRFSQGAEVALSLLRESFQFHIVTNQGGIALGMFEENDLLPIKEKLFHMFRETGAKLTDFHYCPHHPQGKIKEYSIACSCRKPGPLMLQEAAKKHGIELSLSWMIGDILDDVEAGKRAGCQTIFLDQGNETEWVMNDFRKPDFTVKDLEEAAITILLHDKARK